MGTLSDLPPDELLRYAQALGVGADAHTPRGELLQLVQQRQDLLDSLDRAILLELIRWTRRAVREDSSKEELVREIASSKKMQFDGLSQPALYALARLRNLEVDPKADTATLTRALKHAEGFWDKWRRKRDVWLGGMIGHYLVGPDAEPPAEGDYKFLPATPASKPANRLADLQADIEDRGLIGGLTGRLRGAADDYVREKLDEIERRIDRKLDDIDRRLGDWRDRELANRLKIFKLTLLASVIVAAISLFYNLINRAVLGPPEPEVTPPAMVAPSEEPPPQKPKSPPAEKPMEAAPPKP